MRSGEIRCRECKSQSENAAFHSRAGGTLNKNRLSGGPQIYMAFRELKGVVKENKTTQTDSTRYYSLLSGCCEHYLKLPEISSEECLMEL